MSDILQRIVAVKREEIAADLGYTDTSAFYRAFVDWTGMAPAHYRRQWRNEK